MRIARDLVDAAEWRALDAGSAFHVRRAEARYAIEGSGALACLQGLVTSDLMSAPDHSRTFGALLTAKGMIVSPLWIERRSPEALTLEAPARSAAAIEEILAKSLPPRLCRWRNVSDTTLGVGLYGPQAEADITPFPGALPAVARGAKGIEGALPVDDAVLVLDSLQLAGAVRASDALMESCRIMAGIPASGAEIDEKTLPQEVRLEELGAISYTKGCYLGQETVARLHFRGHANRRLVLLVLDGEPADDPAEVHAEGKAVGRLTSACWSEDLDGWVGQAVVRREVEDGATVDAGGVEAVVRVNRWLREP